MSLCLLIQKIIKANKFNSNDLWITFVQGEYCVLKVTVNILFFPFLNADFK